MNLTINQQALITLVRSGLWNQTVELKQFGSLDYDSILQLAEEQAVVGLVTAGLEVVQGEWLKVHGVPIVPQEVLLQFIGSTLQVEQRNKEMNEFVPKLFKKLQSGGVDAVLVKGQGVAQCYEKPLWRASGDVDLLMDEENYEKAKKVLFPLSYDIEQEDVYKKHQALKIMGVEVELHGRMPFGLSEKADKVIDVVIAKALSEHESSELNESVRIPKAEEHVFLVFTHFLRHFFIEGVGLRQICDWCRMLWTYKDSLNYGFLESRLQKAGLMTEWKVFFHLATKYLGMPDIDSRLTNAESATPRHSSSELGSARSSNADFMVQDSRLDAKAEKVLKRVLKSGNFGHNNDLSYRSRYSGITYKVVAMWRRFIDFASLVPVFPVDAPRFFIHYIFRKS